MWAILVYYKKSKVYKLYAAYQYSPRSKCAHLLVASEDFREIAKQIIAFEYEVIDTRVKYE